MNLTGVGLNRHAARSGRSAATSVAILMALVAGLLVLRAPRALADYILMSSHQEVYAQVLITDVTGTAGDTEGFSMDGGGDFTKSASGTTTGNEGSTLTSDASQSSTIPPTGTTISGSGLAQFRAGIAGSGQETGTVSTPDGLTTTSFFDVSFELDVPHTYSAAVSLTESTSGHSYVFADSAAELDMVPLASGSGLLPAGVHHLFVASRVGNEAPLVEDESALGTFEFRLSLTPVSDPNAEADLSITKTDSNDPAPTARNLNYTLTVMNNGPDAASGVVGTDTLPSSVNYVSATPSQGTCDPPSGGVVTCQLGTIGSGGTATVTIAVKPTQAGTITNMASVDATTPDTEKANNTDSEDTSVCRITSRRQSIPCP